MKRIVFLPMLAALLLSACAAPGAASGPRKPYPLKECVVSDNELGSMGPPLVRVYDGQEVKFCCKPCVKKFEKDPQTYLRKIAAASPAAP